MDNNSVVSADSINYHIYRCNSANVAAMEGASSDGSFSGDASSFSSDDYTSINVDDSNYVYDSSDNMHQYHKFRFTIDEDVEDITRIDITWKGYGGTDISNGYSLWVRENGGYVKVDGGTSSNKDTLVKSYVKESDDISDMIESGNLYIAAQSDYEGVADERPPFAGVVSLIRSYYVEINITYNTQNDECQGLVVSNPISVVERESFDVTVTSCSIPIENALVGFNGLNLSTNEFGVVSFSAPEVESDTSFDIFVYRAGYVVNVSSITVLDNSSQDLPVLDIFVSSSVFEDVSFTVTITSDNVAVQGAIVIFSGFSYSTNVQGKVTFTAPSVDENTSYTIVAHKTGYLSAQESITVLDEGSSDVFVLDIFAPSDVLESEIFEVVVKSSGSPIAGVMISFSGAVYYTNNYGFANVLAPSVSSNKSILLSASKSGYLSDETYVLVLNTGSEVYPELVISSDNSVYEGESFTVTVNSGSNLVGGVLVSFNGDDLYTNSVGKVSFNAPYVESKTHFSIVASKSGYVSDSKTIGVLDLLETNIVLISPNGGESVSGVVDILWDVANLDSSASISLFYQVVSGSWVSIVDGLSISSDGFGWDTSVVGDGVYLLKVMLIVGDVVCEDVSDSYFTISNSGDFQRGWVYGKITDIDTFNPIRNAEVCLKLSEKSSIYRCVYTDEAGAYNLSHVKGNYFIMVNKKGYQFDTKAIQINKDEGTLVNFELEIDQNTVTAYKSLLDYTVDEEIRKGSIVGIVDVSAQEEQVLTYDANINLEVSSNDINAEQGINIKISGDGTSGTKIVIYLGELETSKNLIVLYDAVKINQTNDAESFLQIGYAESEYLLTSTIENGVTKYILIINIPHYSQHDITISLEKIVDSLGGTTAVIYYIVFLTLVAFLFVGIGTIRRRL